MLRVARSVTVSYALVIYYFNDDGEATSIWTVGEKYNAANLDISPCGGMDFNFGHCGDLEAQCISSIFNTLATVGTRTDRTVDARQIVVWLGFDNLEIEAKIRAR